MLPTVNHDATTVFFSKRIASGFPGVRNIKTYIDPYEIKRHLDAFFKSPIKFNEATDREGDKEPFWWFRGRLADSVDHYESLPNGIFLIGDKELKIKRITVYASQARYFKEYIYIETSPMHPYDKDYYSLERIEELSKVCDYVEEEYGVFKEGNRQIEVSRTELEDGYSDIDGEFVPIRGRACQRSRFLTPYNMIIAAKYSPYNCDLFSNGSDKYFNGLLNGTYDFDAFHRYLMGFSKYFHL